MKFLSQCDRIHSYQIHSYLWICLLVLKVNTFCTVIRMFNCCSQSVFENIQIIKNTNTHIYKQTMLNSPIYPLWKVANFYDFLISDFRRNGLILDIFIAWKMSDFSGFYFPLFRANAEVNSENIRIQTEYGKIRTRKNSVFVLFSHSVTAYCS